MDWVHRVDADVHRWSLHVGRSGANDSFGRCRSIARTRRSSAINIRVNAKPSFRSSFDLRAGFFHGRREKEIKKVSDVILHPFDSRWNSRWCLYAGGSSRLSSDLSLPKGLLPVGNRPLIWYSLQLIQSHPSLSSSPLLILISPLHRQLFDDYLSTLTIPYELVVTRPQRDSTSDDQQQSSDELGTLDVLRSCSSRIRTESICLLSCDLFGRVNLSPMINMFRVRNAQLILLLLPTSKDVSIAQPGQKGRFTPGQFFDEERK